MRSLSASSLSMQRVASGAEEFTPELTLKVRVDTPSILSRMLRVIPTEAILEYWISDLFLETNFPLTVSLFPSKVNTVCSTMYQQLYAFSTVRMHIRACQTGPRSASSDSRPSAPRMTAAITISKMMNFFAMTTPLFLYCLCSIQSLSLRIPTTTSFRRAAMLSAVLLSR